MDIKKPTPPIQTAYAENNTNNNNFYECLTGVVDAVGGMAEYSTTPVQVGTWVDGSPVYRVAIDVVCADVDAETYKYIYNHNGYLLSIQTTGSKTVINNTVVFGSPVDGVTVCTTTITEQGILVSVPKFGDLLPEDQTDCTTERFYGYVEFVIKSN